MTNSDMPQNPQIQDDLEDPDFDDHNLFEKDERLHPPLREIARDLLLCALDYTDYLADYGDYEDDDPEFADEDIEGEDDGKIPYEVVRESGEAISVMMESLGGLSVQHAEEQILYLGQLGGADLLDWMSDLPLALAQHGHYDSAIEYCDNLAKQAFPGRFLSLKALLLSDNEQKEEALVLAHHCLSTYPGDPIAMERISEVLADCGEYGEAEKVCRGLLDGPLDTEDDLYRRAYVLSRLADVLGEQGREQEAVQVEEELAKFLDETGIDFDDDYEEEGNGEDEEAPPTLAEMAQAAPKTPYVRNDPKVGRNDLCPCGSGKKFKKCHG